MLPKICVIVRKDYQKIAVTHFWNSVIKYRNIYFDLQCKNCNMKLIQVYADDEYILGYTHILFEKKTCNEIIIQNILK